MTDTNAVNTTPPAAAEKDAVTLDDDAQAKFAALEAEKAKAIEEAANWKVAALKAKQKAKDEGTDPDEDDRMEQIARKALADSRLAEIAREQDAIIQKALKENRELKLAALNKKEPSAAAGTHSEAAAVQDTLITADQMAAFKARGWDDKKIERYKKNLVKYSR